MSVRDAVACPDVQWIEADACTWFCWVGTAHCVVEQQGELWVPHVARAGQIEQHPGFFFRSSAMQWAQKRLVVPTQPEPHPTILLNAAPHSAPARCRTTDIPMHNRTIPCARARRRCLLLNRVAYLALGAPPAITLQYHRASGQIRIEPCERGDPGALRLHPPRLGQTCRVDVGRFWRQHGLTTTDGLTFVVTVHQPSLELAPARPA